MPERCVAALCNNVTDPENRWLNLEDARSEGCKWPKVTVNSVTSNYKDSLDIELLLLVTGQKEIQSYLTS